MSLEIQSGHTAQNDLIITAFSVYEKSSQQMKVEPYNSEFIYNICAPTSTANHSTTEHETHIDFRETKFNRIFFNKFDVSIN